MPRRVSFNTPQAGGRIRDRRLTHAGGHTSFWPHQETPVGRRKQAHGHWSENSYQKGQAQLHPGDVLVAFSNGLMEVQNPSGEVVGGVRLQEVIRQNRDRSATGIRDRIEAVLINFAQGTPLTTTRFSSSGGREG